MRGKTMRGIGFLALVAFMLVPLCLLPYQTAYAQEGSLLDSLSLTHVAETPEGNIYSDEGQITISGTDGKRDNLDWRGSHYLTDKTVSGNFVAEVDFCITSYNSFGASYFGLTFYQNTDDYGYGYGYVATVQGIEGNYPTNLASYYYDAQNEAQKSMVKFSMKQPIDGLGQPGDRAILRIAVNNGVVSTYIIVNGEMSIRNTYELSSEDFGVKDGKTLDSGKLGIMVGKKITVNIYDIAVYEYDGFFANEVDKRINDLPENITYADKAVVESARKAYDALSDEQKKSVQSLQKLENAENEVAQIGTDMVDGLIAKIDALKTIEDVSILGEQLAIVKQNYSDMDKDLKVRVTNYSSVAGQEQRYSNLKEIKRQTDERIKKVVDAIDALPQLNVLCNDDEETVREAKALYDALSEEEKAQVSNIECLNSALSMFDETSAPSNDSAKIAFIVLLSLAVTTCIACIVLFALGKKGKKANED